MREFPSKEQIKAIKERYPKGTKLELTDDLYDPYTVIPKGTVGTVKAVDDMCTIHMHWENGSSLGLIPGQDSFKVISRPKEKQELESPKFGDMSL